jgi:hypothetical protein
MPAYKTEEPAGRKKGVNSSKNRSFEAVLEVLKSDRKGRKTTFRMKLFLPF